MSALSATHPAVVNATTLYRGSVKTDLARMILKRGKDNGKLGDVITKGHWRGFVIYQLSLEERATCPRSCVHWADCYGNNMPFAHRHAHGPELEKAIERDIAALAEKHPNGFAVRLHVLGDFYSVRYVKLWERMLRLYPALHVWGYTARDSAGTIGKAIDAMRSDRWQIRHSAQPIGFRTVAIQRPEQAGEAIVCPEQTGKTRGCDTCGLCWTTPKAIAFLDH